MIAAAHRFVPLQCPIPFAGETNPALAYGQIGQFIQRQALEAERESPGRFVWQRAMGDLKNGSGDHSRAETGA
jgi:hypothetical protein